jgi:tetratricopeptide (TPR) repeat protein
MLLDDGRASALQLTPEQKDEMKLHYDKATRAYDVQKYDEAVIEYQKAYEIGGVPAMLFNVAQSYRLANQLEEALRFYRRYLQRSPNARNREDVERKISELEKTVEERRKAAEAAAARATPIAPRPVTPVTQPVAVVRDEGMGATRVAGIVVASVGAAGLITAAITGKLASNRASDLESAAMMHATFDDGLPGKESNGKTYNTVAIVSAIAGGAAVITGVLMIVLSGGSSSSTETARQSMLTPVIGGGFTGALATLRF